MQRALRLICLVASLMALLVGFDVRAQVLVQRKETSEEHVEKRKVLCLQKPEECLPTGGIGQGSGMLNRPIDPGVLKGILNQQRHDLIRQ